MGDRINYRGRCLPSVECFFNPPDMACRIPGHAPHVIAADDKEAQANYVTQEYEQESYLPEKILL